jgi:hypothetical protein
MRVKKSHRLTNRFVVSIIILCLPLARDLKSLSLISTTMGLILWVLLLELYGASCVSETFIGGHEASKYTASCRIRRGDMELAIKSGDMINVQELSKTAEKGLYELS